MSIAKKALIAVLLVVGAVGALLAGKTASMLSAMGGKGGAVSVLESFRDPRGEFPRKDRVNILLIGKDYNRDRKGMPYTKNARSDTLLVLSLDLESQRVSALSIPRDTLVEMPDNGNHARINEAYARGGAPLAAQTVGHFLGVYPDHYIALKPDAVKQIVDLLGGVEVVALDRMKYDDSWGQLHIDLPAGRQTINGEQAVGFTRFRKSNPGEPPSEEEGDERRMARQQMLLKAIAAKAKQPQMLLQADRLIDTALGSIETDLTRRQIFAIAALFRNIQPEQIQTASVPGRNFLGRNGKAYIQPDEEKMHAMVDWLLRGDESAAYRLTVVAVKNGTQIHGAAQQVADLLRVQGFDAKNAGNARTDKARRGSEVTQTQVLYNKAAVQPRARRIVELLHGGTLVKQEDLKDADVTVVLGRDLAPLFAEQEARL